MTVSSSSTRAQIASPYAIRNVLLPGFVETGHVSERRTPIALRLLAAVAVMVAVLAGVYVAGGLITNELKVAMLLTAGWMGLAFLVCAAVVWRRRELAVPVVGAYLVTAAVVGVYLGRSMFFDSEVSEQVVRAAPPAGAPDSAPRERQRNQLLRRGRFMAVAHPAKGTASIIRRAGRGNVLTLTGFEVDNGPDLRVYLVAGPARGEGEVGDFEDLGPLKGNKGNQQYEVPREVGLDRYTTVVIWCRAFSVNFARAPLS